MDSMADSKEAPTKKGKRDLMASTGVVQAAETKRDIAILLYRVDELQKQVQSMHSEFECEFKDMRVAIKGNGKPGIEQRTTDLERQIKLLTDTIEKQSVMLSAHFSEHATEREEIEVERKAVERERRDMINKIILAAVGMMLTNVGTIIAAVIMYRLGLP